MVYIVGSRSIIYVFRAKHNITGGNIFNEVVGMFFYGCKI